MKIGWTSQDFFVITVFTRPIGTEKGGPCLLKSLL